MDPSVGTKDRLEIRRSCRTARGGSGREGEFVTVIVAGGENDVLHGM
jgi:hypothetical protein